jgi:hypothetical protein
LDPRSIDQFTILVQIRALDEEQRVERCWDAVWRMEAWIQVDFTAYALNGVADAYSIDREVQIYPNTSRADLLVNRDVVPAVPLIAVEIKAQSLGNPISPRVSSRTGSSSPRRAVPGTAARSVWHWCS